MIKHITSIVMIVTMFVTCLSCLHAQNVLKIEDTIAFAGETGVTVRILVDNADHLNALSFAARFPDELTYSTPDNASIAADTLMGPGNLNAEWVFQNLIEDGDTQFFYMASVIDFTSPFDNRTLPPGNDQYIFTAFFDVADGLTPGEELLIDIRDDLGDPVIRPVFTIQGQSLVPTLQDGRITIVAPLAVTSVSPSFGSSAGGTALTITGSHFTDDCQVSVGGLPLADVTVVDANTITGTTPPHASGLVGVTITNAYSSSSLPNTFMYIATPVIDSVQPALGSGGEEITINGSHFTTLSDTTVHFGDTPSPQILEVTTTAIRCIMPACSVLNAWTEIRVTTSGGTDTLPEGYYCTPTFRRGDANCDTKIDLADAVVILNHLFVDNSTGNTLPCMDALDLNDDGYLDVSDCVYLLAFTFSSMDAPPAPFPGLGIDPTEDGITCMNPCNN